MDKFSKIFYLCEIFEKLAEDVSVSSVVKDFKDQLDTLLYKNLPAEEIENWVSSNKSTLDRNNITSLIYYHFDPFDDYIRRTKLNESTNEVELTIISTESKLKDNYKYDIVSESFLRGYKHIPNLYIFKAVDSGFSKAPIEKALAHDEFMINALAKITNSYYDKDFKKIHDFVKEHRNKIDEIRSLFSYAPKKLGEGADGVAFDIGKDKVLKIFQDSYSFNKAKEAVERLHKNPDLAKTEAMIYDVGFIGNIDNHSIYYYVMEKVKPVYQSNIYTHVSKIINMILGYIRNEKDLFFSVKKYIDNPAQQNLIKKFVSDEGSKLESFIRNQESKFISKIESEEDLNKNWLKNLCEEVIFKYLTGRGDLHMGNIGITNYGNFKYFDPAHESYENDLNGPSNDSIDYGMQKINEK